MNQKIVKFILIGGVIVVWGLIIYRIVDGLNGGNNTPILEAAGVPATNFEPKADSFTLIADYADPFIAAKDTVEAEPAITIMAPLINSPAPAVIKKTTEDVYKEGTIQYLGMIANPQKKLKIATIEINGKEMLVKEKEKVEGYIMKRIESEKIIIIFKGNSIIITKNK
jgi:hypothetical protein